MFSFKQGPACCCCWSCLICSCAKAKHARSTVLTCLTSPWNPLQTCFSSHHAVPLHFWPFLDNVHWVCKYYGGGGLVAKSCLAVATPWTVACQAPRWNLRISDWATLCLQQEGFISQTSNNTVSRSKKPSAHKMWKSKKGSVLWNLKDS